MIRVLIADDEAPARAKIAKLLAREADVEIAGEAADGEQAVELIERLAPDLLFLDIQMPRLDGFGVIASVGVDAVPVVVFVTAYDEHALRAFEVHALDYLLKPFAPSRFARVLARARQQLAAGSTAELARRLAGLLAAVGSGERYLSRVLVEKGDEREVLLPVEAIDRIASDRNVVRFFTSRGELTRRGTLAALEARLDPAKFLRINRSEIVRLDAVRELEPWFHGDYRVVMRDGSVLTWSRRYRARSKDRF